MIGLISSDDFDNKLASIEKEEIDLELVEDDLEL